MKPIIYIHTQQKDPAPVEQFLAFIDNIERHPAAPRSLIRLSHPTISQLEDAVKFADIVLASNWEWYTDTDRASWQEEILDNIIRNEQTIIISSDEPIRKEYYEHALTLKYYRPTVFT